MMLHKDKTVIELKFIFLTALLPALFNGILLFLTIKFWILGMVEIYKIFNLLFIASILIHIIYTKFLLQRYDKTLSLNLERTKSLLKEQEKIGQILIRRDLELTQANEELRKLDKMKSEFIGIVAHQLRTPLSGIKWTLNMLLSNDIKSKEDQKAFLMKANESNNRMITLVNDMLITDRIEAYNVKYDIRPVQIKDLLDSVLYEVLPQINKKNISVHTDNLKDDLPKVNIDAKKMRAVFQNLLENAIRYVEPSGKITLDFSVKKRFVQFSIQDDGIGIPENQQKNIFNKFFRGDNAKRKVADGSGLGLFIAKTIVENHGGKIWFESTQDKGTTFYITLPLSK